MSGTDDTRGNDQVARSSDYVRIVPRETTPTAAWAVQMRFDTHESWSTAPRRFVVLRHAEEYADECWDIVQEAWNESA